jgi:hypothetical protein
MSDRFEEVEEPKIRVARDMLIAGLIVCTFLLLRFSAWGPKQATGVVESSGAISVPKIAGGTREEAYVRLADGTLVFAYVVSGGPLSKGDKVFLLETHRLWGGAVYQVVGKESRH